MNFSLLNQIGDWNPQLFRELKGRLNLRNVLAVVTVSVIAQILLVLYFYTQIPADHLVSYNHYVSCTSNNICTINWSKWWFHIFRVLSWILPLFSMMGGLNVLITDMAYEERRGTLNFIRLSPQSTQRILWGKILGSPFLIYLGLALAIPLHWYSAIASGVPLAFLLSHYLLLFVGCGLFYCTALLYVCLGGNQGWLGSALAGVSIFSYLGIMEREIEWSQFHYPQLKAWQWFYLPIGANVVTIHAFLIATISLATYWVWQALNRCFRNPNATLLSKQHSYFLVSSFQVWLLGFFVANHQTSYDSFEEGFLTWLLLSVMINLLLFFGLIAALSPHRLTLQDWARFAHTETSKAAHKIHGWIWGERSPATLAIAINLAIVAIIWSSWILLWPGSWITKGQAICALLFSFNLIWIYAAITQLMLMLKTRVRSVWAVLFVISVIVLPPLLMIPFGSFSVGFKSTFLLSSVFIGPWFVFASSQTFDGVLVAFLIQGLTIILLNFQLNRQLHCLGESASKAILGKKPQLSH